jgi:spore coat polysaccharide biosynthesis protein SpsF (cytidylyltransferase family)
MICAIIQARMGSTRLPGKVLKPIIADKTALELMIMRVSVSTMIDKIIVATTTQDEDNSIEDLCKELDVLCMRGNTHDVLDRYYQAAIYMNSPQYIVRLTADCPLHDSDVIDQTIRGFLSGEYDYGSNQNYPDGLDVEIFTMKTLKKLWEQATMSSEREHVTPYAYKNSDQFSVFSNISPVDYSNFRWTLDEPDDYKLIQKIYQHFGKDNTMFSMGDILDLLKKKPDLNYINNTIIRNEGYLKSLEADMRLQ